MIFCCLDDWFLRMINTYHRYSSNWLSCYPFYILSYSLAILASLSARILFSLLSLCHQSSNHFNAFHFIPLTTFSFICIHFSWKCHRIIHLEGYQWKVPIRILPHFFYRLLLDLLLLYFGINHFVDVECCCLHFWKN